MKKFVSLLMCVITIMIMPLNAHAQMQNSFTDNENFIVVQDFVQSNDIYDIGLFSNINLAIAFIGNKNPTFLDLCNDPNTISSLNMLIEVETDSFLKKLMTDWYIYLADKFNYSLPSSRTSGDYDYYPVTLPGGKVLDGEKYVGSSTPGNYPSISNYSTASLLYGSSYKYNCHSFAWYLHGDINSHNPQLCFDYSSDFRVKTPSCARKLRASENPQVGDIVVYYNPYDMTEETHSAIITSVSSGTAHNQITVKSKWREYGVYSHKLSDCPYYFDQTNGNTHYQSVIEYYRLSHIYILNGSYYYCKGCGYKNPIMVTSSYE